MRHAHPLDSTVLRCINPWATYDNGLRVRAKSLLIRTERILGGTLSMWPSRTLLVVQPFIQCCRHLGLFGVKDLYLPDNYYPSMLLSHAS